jgi:AcrR family transcriptional regulator
MRILQAAAAVSLEDVEREAGVGRSQLYHYFDGRDDLLRTVIDITTDAVLGAQTGCSTSSTASRPSTAGPARS